MYGMASGDWRAAALGMPVPFTEPVVSLTTMLRISGCSRSTASNNGSHWLLSSVMTAG